MYYICVHNSLFFFENKHWQIQLRISGQWIHHDSIAIRAELSKMAAQTCCRCRYCLSFFLLTNAKQRQIITELAQKAVVISYIVTPLILSLLCCWATNTQHWRQSKQHVTFDSWSTSFSVTLNAGLVTSTTKQLRSMRRENPSQPFSRTMSYLAHHPLACRRRPPKTRT